MGYNEIGWLKCYENDDRIYANVIKSPVSLFKIQTFLIIDINIFARKAWPMDIHYNHSKRQCTLCTLTLGNSDWNYFKGIATYTRAGLRANRIGIYFRYQNYTK